jgi:hypothetical protein
MNSTSGMVNEWREVGRRGRGLEKRVVVWTPLCQSIRRIETSSSFLVVHVGGTMHEYTSVCR